MYRGSIVLDGDGQGRVDLPNYFEALNSDFTYHLTSVGGYAPVYVSQEVQDNAFQIAGGTPGLKVSWMVTGTRNDPWAADHPYQPVIEKDENDSGRYFYPAGYGQPEKLSIARNLVEQAAASELEN